jgi:hypothetical protein
VQWVSGEQKFPLESLTDKEVLGAIDMAEAERKLGVLEESMSSLEKILADNPATEPGFVFVTPVES